MVVDKGSILFFSEDIHFLFKNKIKTRKWIYHCMKSEGKSIDSVNIIFCSDPFLYKLNRQYLKHDTYTDIITFDLSDSSNIISGDIYISIDRIKDNAKQFETTFLHELHRVIIHGFLHLSGYKDKTKPEKQLMRSKEDICLSLQPKFFD
ncbi:MAG: rRNA maturation RNase YbeY [Bacteroidetes bacterium]|nr:rRNA maturation RNase YbeY [Bacteroidota bacterium]